MHIVHCMGKPRLDLESAHQASHFEYKNIQIGQIEADPSQLNVSAAIKSV